jgi:cyclo(L-tyrosyl-L-tyrosyl) synthase
VLNLAEKQDNMLNFHNTISKFQYSIEYDPKIHPNNHALIGVSPFNGYFTTSNIEKTLIWAHSNFKSFEVFTMDKASKYNLIAMGYSENEAIKKTTKQDQHLKNKIIRGLESIGFCKDESKKKILLISNLCGDDKYIEVYEHCKYLFRSNSSFRDDCLNASKQILLDKTDHITDELLDVSVQYLLEELPVWINTPYILNVPFSVFVYKDLSTHWYNIFNKYGLVSDNQKILVNCLSEN